MPEYDSTSYKVMCLTPGEVTFKEGGVGLVSLFGNEKGATRMEEVRIRLIQFPASTFHRTVACVMGKWGSPQKTRVEVMRHIAKGLRRRQLSIRGAGRGTFS